METTVDQSKFITQMAVIYVLILPMYLWVKTYELA